MRIDEFLENVWHDYYYYVIKYTDNIRALRNTRQLNIHYLKHELIEYLFDAANKDFGPRKIEMVLN